MEVGEVRLGVLVVVVRVSVALVASLGAGDDVAVEVLGLGDGAAGQLSGAGQLGVEEAVAVLTALLTLLARDDEGRETDDGDEK